MITEAAMRDDVVLALTGITKRFGATAALDNVSFALRRGTVHALLGENGAGKTTLMRVAFGLLAPDAGNVVIVGRTHILASPADAIAAGIGMVHQHFTNVPAMTVAENVALGGSGRFRKGAAAARVREIAERTGLTLDPDVRAEDLPVGAQQRLEIVKALARDAGVLILDEPTAVLAPAEAEELLRWLRTFATQGNAVVLITHKLKEALAVADEVTVLRRGRVTLRSKAFDVTTGALASAMLGEDMPAEAAVRGEDRPASIIVRATNVNISDSRGASVVRGATFEIAAGQIVGIAAVEGAGQHELLRALAGRLRPTSGELRAPSAIGFVPEDRLRDALVLDFGLAENVALKNAGTRRGRLRLKDIRRRSDRLVRTFDVRGGDPTTLARSLSGGNQQKLVLARELDGEPLLLVAENPTRGLDIRATRAVHEHLRSAATRGAAVVVYSSDLDEVLSLATRVLVIHGGTVRECPLDRDTVGRAMLGVT